MEDLDNKIDFMARQKLISLAQENAVRIKKINIRFTKNNQKNTQERYDALCDSYERLLREIPRQLVKIEKDTRRKYMVAIDSQRIRSLITRINTEIDIIFKEMKKDVRPGYVPFKTEEAFDARLDKSTTSARENLEKYLLEIEETLRDEISSSNTLSPVELGRFYELDESALVDLKAIKPLQKMHSFFNARKGDETLDKIFDAVNQSIRSCVNIGKNSGQGFTQAHTPDSRRIKKMKVIAETFLLRDFICNLDILMDQLISPPEKRNLEMARKTWARLVDLLGGSQEKEEILSHLKILNDTVSG